MRGGRGKGEWGRGAGRGIRRWGGEGVDRGI